MPSMHTLHPFLRAARILVHPRPVARTKTVMTAVLAMIGMMMPPARAVLLGMAGARTRSVAARP